VLVCVRVERKIKLDSPQVRKLGRLQDGVYLAPFDRFVGILRMGYCNDKFVHARAGDTGERLNETFRKFYYCDVEGAQVLLVAQVNEPDKVVPKTPDCEV